MEWAVHIGAEAGYEAHFGNLTGAVLVESAGGSLFVAAPCRDFRLWDSWAEKLHPWLNGLAEINQLHKISLLPKCQTIKRMFYTAQLVLLLDSVSNEFA